MNVITQDLQDAIFKVFTRLEKHGCVGPWGEDPKEAKNFQFDACAVLVDNGITAADIAAAYGALLGMECIRYKRWPSNREILEAINSRRPDASETAIKAEAIFIFEKIDRAIMAGGAREAFEARVRDAFGLAASEALASIGGVHRLDSTGDDFLGAVRTLFQKAYLQAVQSGRPRGNPNATIPAFVATLALGSHYARLTGISEVTFESLGLGSGVKQISGSAAPKAIPSAPRQNPEQRLAELRRQGEELMSQEPAQ